MKHTLKEFPLAALESAFEYAKANPSASIQDVLIAIPEPPVDESGERQYYYDKAEMTACVELAKSNPESTFLDFYKGLKHEDFDLKAR